MSICLLACTLGITAKDIELGEWRSHFSYSQGQSIEKVENQIFAVASGSLFSYGLKDNSIVTYSKKDGLHDVGITLIRYSALYNVLVICYENGNIDLKRDNEFMNVPDIKIKTITGSKKINNITFKDKFAYLSTDLGIIILNLERDEIKESYFLAAGGKQNPVHEVAFYEGDIYAATENGLFKAPEDHPNLLNFANWLNVSSAPEYTKPYRFVKNFGGQLLATRSDSDESLAYTYLFTNNTWEQRSTTSRLTNVRITDDFITYSTKYSIVCFNSDFDLVSNIKNVRYSDESLQSIDVRDGFRLDSTKYFLSLYDFGAVSLTPEADATILSPDGPSSNSVWDIDITEDVVRVVPGAVNISWGFTRSKGAVSIYSDSRWSVLDSKNIPELAGGKDFLDIQSDPLDPQHFFVASYGYGLFEFQEDQLLKIHNRTNSALIDLKGNDGYTIINSLAYDENHNLWMSNGLIGNSIQVYKDDQKWTSFKYTAIDDVGDVIYAFGDMLVAKDNTKWVMLPRRQGIFVFNENGTFDTQNDDDYVLIPSILSQDDGETEQISNETYCIVEDQDGSIWIGTSNGIAIFYNPEQVFDNTSFFPASRIKLPRLDDDDGLADYLLNGESIYSLAVDGGNRKWIGTGTSGVFLMSADGLTTIHHFTTENSILPSNNIRKIALDPITGEVFIATSKGLVSFRGDATQGEDVYEHVKVFPNPVREDFTGTVSISGLVPETNVKITDITGNLVYETKSNGGTAAWDAKNFYGERVGTGVYMIFCSNEDGSLSTMTKILVINNK